MAARVLNRFLGSPPDAYTVDIERACALEEPREVFTRRAFRSTGGIARLTARHLLCMPDDTGGSAHWLLRGGASVADFLGSAAAAQERCHQMPLLLLPQVVVDLIFADRWKTCVVMARWHCFLQRRHGRRQLVRSALPLFPEWPPDEWLQRVLGQPLAALAAGPGASEPETVRLTSARLSQLASMVRAWSANVLHATSAEHEVEQRRALVDALRLLDGWAERLYIYVFVHVHTCIHIRIIYCIIYCRLYTVYCLLYTHRHIYIYVYCTYTYIYMYIYIYIYM